MNPTPKLKPNQWNMKGYKGQLRLAFGWTEKKEFEKNKKDKNGRNHQSNSEARTKPADSRKMQINHQRKQPLTIRDRDVTLSTRWTEGMTKKRLGWFCQTFKGTSMGERWWWRNYLFATPNPFSSSWLKPFYLSFPSAVNNPPATFLSFSLSNSRPS